MANIKDIEGFKVNDIPIVSSTGSLTHPDFISQKADTTNLLSVQNKFLKINSCKDKEITFAPLVNAINSDTINIAIIGDSVSTAQPNVLSLSDAYVAKLKKMIAEKYPGKTINFYNLAISGTIISQYNSVQTIAGFDNATQTVSNGSTVAFGTNTMTISGTTWNAAYVAGTTIRISGCLASPTNNKVVKIVERTTDAVLTFAAATFTAQTELSTTALTFAKPWIELCKDKVPDMLVVAFGMNNGSIASAKIFKFYLQTIIDYATANFAKIPTVVVIPTPVPTQNGSYGTTEAQNSRNLAAFSARWYGYNRYAYVMDVNRLYNIKRNGFDTNSVYNNGAEPFTVSGTYADGTNAGEMVIQATGTKIQIDTSVSNFICKFDAKFESFPSGVENLRVEFGGTTGLLPNIFMLIPNSTGAKIWSYGNNADTYYPAVVTKSSTISESSYSDGTYRSYTVEKINNVLKVYVNSIECIQDSDLAINNTPGVITLKKDAGSTGIITIKNISLQKLNFETYPEMLTDEQMWGVYVSDANTATKMPYGGNGLNHPSSIGKNQVYDPCIDEFINDLPSIEINKLKNAQVTVTTAEIVAGKTLIAAVPGRQIKVLRYFVLSTGDFSGGGGTSVPIQDNNSSPIVVTTIGKAALTDGAKISSGVTVANVTDGAGFMAALTSGKSLVIPASVGISVGTSVTISIDYMIV